AADGRPGLRNPPSSPRKFWLAINKLLLQLFPPLVELKAIIPPKPSMGTTTLPLGCTRGWPPSPPAPSAVFLPALQVLPPSVDVLMKMRSPNAGSSHST